jgi:prepilin-type N-terminal cleavage/methylation domain-containing protein
MTLAVKKKRGSSGGFSLVEMMVVVAIVMVIAAFAIPNMMNVIATFRLRGGMSSLSSLLQNARMMSIKGNQTYSVHFTTMSAGPVAYVKLAGDTAGILNTDAQAQLGAPVTMDQNPTGTGAPTQMDNSFLNFDPLTSDPSFNSRGIPCIYASGTCTAPKGYVFYFRGKRSFGTDGWAAVTISPAGHVKTWYWNGSSWGN